MIQKLKKMQINSIYNMKHLKTFEEIEIENKNFVHYWIIGKTEIEYCVSLQKLSKNDDHYSDILLDEDSNINFEYKEEYENYDVLVALYREVAENNINSYGEWVFLDERDFHEYFKKNKINRKKYEIKYIGEINVTPQEIKKYELEKSIKKFNI